MGWFAIVLGLLWAGVMGSEFDPRSKPSDAFGLGTELCTRQIWKNPLIVLLATLVWVYLLAGGIVMLWMVSSTQGLMGIGLIAIAWFTYLPWYRNKRLTNNKWFQPSQIAQNLCTEIERAPEICRVAAEMMGTNFQAPPMNTLEEQAIHALVLRKNNLGLSEDEIIEALKEHWEFDSDCPYWKAVWSLSQTAFARGARIDPSSLNFKPFLPQERPTDLGDHFAKLKSFLADEELQNSKLEDPIRTRVLSGIDCDEVPDSSGEFGRTITNPIPANGPIGEVIYLSRLRFANNSRLLFHRLGSVQQIDVYEIVSEDGAAWDLLFMSMYHPRKSRKTPKGLAFVKDESQKYFFTGCNHTLSDFPQGLSEAITQCSFDWLGVPLRAPDFPKVFAFGKPIDHSRRVDEFLLGGSDPELIKLMKAAEQGDADAQFDLGAIYQCGTGVAKNTTEACRWYQMAADQGHAGAQYYIGLMYENGAGVARNSSEAIKWYKRSADLDDSDAQYKLGSMYYHGNGVMKDLREAIKWYRMAAENGNAEAQFELGAMYDLGDDVDSDQVEASKWYQKAAEQGLDCAQYILGRMYESGDGVTYDAEAAISLYLKAAEQGHASSQYRLGTMYDSGKGVEKNTREAISWYRKAAEQGQPEAQCKLGLMYRDGKGLDKDPVTALGWFQKAADQDYALAQRSLALMLANTEGVKQDLAEAALWFEKAAKHGDASSQVSLGAMYAHGSGVEKDKEKAAKWYFLAASHYDDLTPAAQEILQRFFKHNKPKPDDHPPGANEVSDKSINSPTKPESVELKDCSFCGKSVRKKAIICKHCNALLAESRTKECPWCAEHILVGAKTCPYCDRRLSHT